MQLSYEYKWNYLLQQTHFHYATISGDILLRPCMHHCILENGYTAFSHSEAGLSGILPFYDLRKNSNESKTYRKVS